MRKEAGQYIPEGCCCTRRIVSDMDGGGFNTPCFHNGQWQIACFKEEKGSLKVTEKQNLRRCENSEAKRK